MAQRDRAQGFGFMYADISKLIAKKKELEKEGAFTPVAEPNTQSINLNRDPQPKATPINEARANTVSSGAFMKERSQAISQIRENLDRLQSLHHKLHAMLEDLNKITDKDKKRTSD